MSSSDFGKKTGATGTVAVQSMGSATIDGAASYSLAAQWQFVDVISDCPNYLIVGSN